MLLFWPGWLFFRLIASRYHLTAEGRSNLPGHGRPMIIVSNHNARRDPVIINLVLRRPVHYMAKKENFDWHRGIFECMTVRLFGAFPVDRERPGPEVVRTTERLLAEGSCVGIFPEGTRHPDQLLHPFENGAAYMAWKTGATLLPVAVFNDGRDVVRIGRPFEVPEMEGRPREVLPLLTAIIRDRIAELLPPDWVVMPR